MNNNLLEQITDEIFLEANKREFIRSYHGYNPEYQSNKHEFDLAASEIEVLLNGVITYYDSVKNAFDTDNNDMTAKSRMLKLLSVLKPALNPFRDFK